MKRRAHNSTLPASDTPLPRGKRINPRNAKRKGSRFPKRRDPAYCAWIRTLPCAARDGYWQFPNERTRRCAGRIECAHVRTRGAGAYDTGETLPLCVSHHRQQHHMGLHSFEQLYGLDMAEFAANLYRQYLGNRSRADAARRLTEAYEDGR